MAPGPERLNEAPRAIHEVNVLNVPCKTECLVLECIRTYSFLGPKSGSISRGKRLILSAQWQTSLMAALHEDIFVTGNAIRSWPTSEIIVVMICHDVN